MARVLVLRLVLVLAAVSSVAAKFSCPSWTKLTEDRHVFPDPEQCDKFWTCTAGAAKRSLCPDGLAFNPNKAEAGEDPCDGIHNIPGKCKGKDKLQRPKPGDAHCPRQNGVYPSEDPFECSVFYSCLNGVGSPTRCAEGLHYSDEIGTCVWAVESGREGCVSQAERRKQKTKAKQGPKSNAPTTEKPTALSNGFICPGGKLGVHPALPHPNSCRQYYVCLDGATATEAGCTKGKVFNPDTQQCDQPENVPGCEDFYNPNAKKKKSSIAQTLDADGDSADFAKFLQLLKASGVLKNGVLGSLTSNSFQMGADLEGINLGGGGARGTKRLGGGSGGRRAGRPFRRGPGGRRGERPRGRRPGNSRPLKQKRPFLGGRQVDYNYADDDYNYDYTDYYGDYGQAFPQERSGAGRGQADSQQENIVRQPQIKRKPFSPRNKPAKEEEHVQPKIEKAKEESRASKPFREVPKHRQNKFTSKFIPRVIPTGNTENLHSVALIRENFIDNEITPIPEDIKTEAPPSSPHNFFTQRRPRPLSRIPSKPTALGQPKNIADILDRISAIEETTLEPEPTSTTPSPRSHDNMASLLKRNRQSLFSSRTKFRASLTTTPTTTTTTTTTHSQTVTNGFSRSSFSRAKLRPSFLKPSNDAGNTIPQTASLSQTEPIKHFTRRLPTLTATAAPRTVAPTPQQIIPSTEPVFHSPVKQPPQPSAEAIALITSRLFGDMFEDAQASQADPQVSPQTAPAFQQPPETTESSIKKLVLQQAIKATSPVEPTLQVQESISEAQQTAPRQVSEPTPKTALTRQPTFRKPGSRIRSRSRFIETNSIHSEPPTIRSRSRSRVSSVSQASRPETNNERNVPVFRSSRRQDTVTEQSFRKPAATEPIIKQELEAIGTNARQEPTVINPIRRREPVVAEPIRRREPVVVEPIRRPEPTVVEPIRQRDPVAIEAVKQDPAPIQKTRSRSRSRSRLRLPTSSESSSHFNSRRKEEELEALRMARLRGRILEFVTTRTSISDDDNISEAKEMLRAKIESLKLTNKHRARGRRSPVAK